MARKSSTSPRCFAEARAEVFSGPFAPGEETSRMPPPRLIASVVMLTAVTLTAVVAVPAQTGRKGGVLRTGMTGEPPTLDAHATTATITREITVNMYEGLYALDARHQPVPLLAEGHDVADGGKRYTIRLRRDVKFHNGKPLTSDDVVVSLKRWGGL